MQKTLISLKRDEASLRAQILKGVFNWSATSSETGTKTLELGKGYKLKTTFALDYKIESAEAITEVLETIPVAYAAGLVDWKPTLNLRKFKDLPPEVAATVEQALVIAVKTPSLKLERDEKC